MVENDVDAAAFAAFHLPAVTADTARLGMLLMIVNALARGEFAGTRWWTLGPPGCCAVWKEHRPLVIGDADAVQSRALLDATDGLWFRAVQGVPRSIAHFVRHATASGQDYEAPMRFGYHQLTDPPRFPAIAGAARTSTAADAPLLTIWARAFHDEATPRDVPPEPAAIEPAAAEGQFMLWVIGETPVAKAAIVRRTSTSAGISQVYTPPALRGRGYAGAVTAATAARIFAEGLSLAYLFTDLSNPASNRCYARVGFRKTGEMLYQTRLR